VKKDKSMPDVLTTQQAAKMLGLSVSSVQKMVISGALNAWVTPGGHRRILRAAVEQLTDLRTKIPAPDRRVTHSRMRVLIAEDEPLQVQFIKALLEKCTYPVDLTVATDASMALIQLERQRPDLVITDLIMQPLDGFHLIRTLEIEPAYFPIDVIVVSAMDRAEAATRGHLPDWVTYYQKPVHAERLIGYLDSMQTRVLKRQEGVALALAPKKAQ
jgi:excisionase family DNA binding protein